MSCRTASQTGTVGGSGVRVWVCVCGSVTGVWPPRHRRDSIERFYGARAHWVPGSPRTQQARSCVQRGAQRYPFGRATRKAVGHTVSASRRHVYASRRTLHTLQVNCVIAFRGIEQFVPPNQCSRRHREPPMPQRTRSPPPTHTHTHTHTHSHMRTPARLGSLLNMAVVAFNQSAAVRFTSTTLRI